MIGVSAIDYQFSFDVGAKTSGFGVENLWYLSDLKSQEDNSYYSKKFLRYLL